MRIVLGKEEYTQLMGFPGSVIWKSAVRLDALRMSIKKVGWEREPKKGVMDAHYIWAQRRKANPVRMSSRTPHCPIQTTEEGVR